MAKFKLEDGTEIEAFTADEVKAQVEAEVAGLKAKVDELLGEKKTVSQKAKELEEAQAKAEEERLKEKQEFKTLYEKEQQTKQELQEQYELYRQRVERQELALASSKLVSELTRDTARAELLAEKAQGLAKYTDDGVIYEIGGVSVDAKKVAEHLREKYPFLVDGSGASGGGATGNNGSGGAVKKFDQMNGAELSALRKENPQEYDRLRKEFYG